MPTKNIAIASNSGNGFQMYFFVSNITFVSLQHWFAALKYGPVKKCKYVSVKKNLMF